MQAHFQDGTQAGAHLLNTASDGLPGLISATTLSIGAYSFKNLVSAVVDPAMQALGNHAVTKQMNEAQKKLSVVAAAEQERTEAKIAGAGGQGAVGAWLFRMVKRAAGRYGFNRIFLIYCKLCTSPQLRIKSGLTASCRSKRLGGG